MWSEALALARLTCDLPAFLRTPLSADEAGRRVQRRLATRAQSFLALAERAIFAEPRSPYRRLLAAAGCEVGDLRRLVAEEGLEGALTRLAASGVYVTFDEFKGRRPIVRGSTRIECRAEDFDNPGCPISHRGAHGRVGRTSRDRAGQPRLSRGAGDGHGRRAGGAATVESLVSALLARRHQRHQGLRSDPPEPWVISVKTTSR